MNVRIDPRFYVSHGPFSLSELLDGLSANLPDPVFADESVEALAPLAESQAGDLTFLKSKTSLSALDTAHATACFVTPELQELVGEKSIIPILSQTPRAHFARVAAKLVSPRSQSDTDGPAGKIAKTARVHSTAVLGAGVIIEDGVDIAPYAVIGPGVSIGAGSRIGAHCSVSFAILGTQCTLKDGAVIGGSGFGVTDDENGIIDIPHLGRVILGDGVSIGSQSCVDRGQLGDTVIGNHTKIDNLVQIAHNVRMGTACAIAGHTGISGSCVLGDRVTLGGSVGLADHIYIGDGASIAARSGVMHNIPAGETWLGTPAQPIRDEMRMIARMRKLTRTKKS